MCLWAAIAPAQSEAPAFEVRGPRREVTEGARFEVSFVLKNETALRFIPPDFGGLNVRTGPAEIRSAGYANGKAYSQQSWVYELEAGSAGSYTIGPAQAQTAQRNFRSQPLTVRVVKSSVRRLRKGSTSAEKEPYFVMADVSPEQAWLGQQLLYRLRLYTRVSVSEADLIELPSFDGFYVLERQRYDTRQQHEKVEGKVYSVRTLYEASLFAQRTGALAIGPARLRLLVEGRERGLLGGTPAIAASNAVSVEVRPLPEPHPERFCGVVGQYAWTVSADKQALTTDDALTLTVRIQGNGDARRFVNPRFELPQTLEAFDPEVREQEEYETGDEFVHQRTLTYAILPKEPGTYLFTPEMTFFHPDSGTYQTLRTEKPVEITVVPGANYGKSAPLPDTAVALPPPETSAWWESIEEDMAKPWVMGMAGMAALFVLAWLAALLWQRRRRKAQATDLAAAEDRISALPDSRALHAQLQQLRHRLSDSAPEAFYRELLRWLERAVAAYLSVPPFMLSRHVALKQLAARGVPAAVVEAIAEVWERCEKAAYAHVAPPEHMRTCWEKAQLAWKHLSGRL
ncbi:MAG: BatD family protein [Saprospiraceae bacterium]|nr:BatD family protein [Saprospiraceae bacterium]